MFGRIGQWVRDVSIRVLTWQRDGLFSSHSLYVGENVQVKIDIKSPEHDLCIMLCDTLIVTMEPSFGCPIPKHRNPSSELAGVGHSCT